MKKILIFLLIPIMFVGFAINSSTSPPRSLNVRSYEELVEIRKMVEAGEKAFLDYREQTGRSFYGVINFEEIKIFLSVLDLLPVPIINGKELIIRRIIYNLDVQEITSISYICTDGYIYSFSIWDFRPMTAAERIKERYYEEPILLYQSEDENVKIYAAPQAIPRNPNAFIRFVIDFYGYFIEATYWHEDITDYSNISAEELLGGVTLGTINDLEIMHERRAPLTTSDALTILRAIAGMVTLTDAQIARYGISGTPATADAMRILRVVAGL
ncbi:MAG: hypothetical protein LBD23_20060 [Oscillospiraceae bacterium]|jgi:hypothetical protein|nr:hypothetical protein [Oscillospiraceae bacterium]